jgi:TonB-dependent receptor
MRALVLAFTLPWRGALVVSALAAAFVPAASVRAAEAVVTGRVVDDKAGGALPGAVVRVDGTSLETVTDARGRFRLSGIPEGESRLGATYLGFEPATLTIRVANGDTPEVELRLRLRGYAETITVEAPILEGQAKALNQQQNSVRVINVVSADQIGAFPDPNAAEAVQRVPGISIERDQGEGRYVLVRGTEARLNSMMVNGERIPSPEGDIRNVALDVIPADLLESIEITKTLTPDMDGDAIGGAVNLVTSQAPDRRRAFLSVGGGYNSISEGGIGRATGSWAQRFGEDKVGLVLSGSYLKTNRGSHNFEVAYDDGDLDELENRHYTVDRERWGLNAALDFRLDGGGQVVFRGLYNDYSDLEYRRRKRERVGDDRIERELKDRLETQTIAAFSAAGKHVLSGGWAIDYSASVSRAEEDEPEAFYSIFRQSKVVFDPNVSPESIDPDDIRANPLNEDFSKFTLNEQSSENNLTSDRDWTGAFNLTRAFLGDSRSSFLKLGAKYRDKTKKRENSTTVYDPDGTFPLSDYTDPGFSPGTTIIDGRYVMGPFIGPSQGRSLIRGFGGERDPEADAANYDASERVAAGYAMAQLNLGDRLMLLPGVRVEWTDVDYTGYRVAYDDEGDYVGTTPQSGTNSYATWLPGVNLRYRVGTSANVRAAVTRSLARPNYFDLTPYQLVLDEDLEIERGNPDLLATTSWNFDFLYERFLPSVGVASAGVFHKRLNDYIYFFTDQQDISGDLYRVREPRNGDAATLTGFELALQNRLSFLPAPLDGLGFYGNYTFTDSEAEFPGRDGEKASLPGQSRHVGNLALTYEKGGFSGRVALNFHGKYISEVGEEASGDIYYDDHVQLDLSASQRITKGLRLFAEVNNLTNEPLRYYEGVSDRPIQEEYYRWWGSFGLKWDF